MLLRRRRLARAKARPRRASRRAPRRRTGRRASGTARRCPAPARRPRGSGSPPPRPGTDRPGESAARRPRPPRLCALAAAQALDAALSGRSGVVYSTIGATVVVRWPLASLWRFRRRIRPARPGTTSVPAIEAVALQRNPARHRQPGEPDDQAAERDAAFETLPPTQQGARQRAKNSKDAEEDQQRRVDELLVHARERSSRPRGSAAAAPAVGAAGQHAHLAALPVDARLPALVLRARPPCAWCSPRRRPRPTRPRASPNGISTTHQLHCATKPTSKYLRATPSRPSNKKPHRRTPPIVRPA